MSGKYDRILKEILGKSIRVFVRKILGIDAVKITLLDTKMQITHEREADFLLRARNEISESDGEGFLPNAQGAKRLVYWMYRSLLATQRMGKKTIQMAHLFRYAP